MGGGRGAVGTGRKLQNEKVGGEDAHFLPLPPFPSYREETTLGMVKGPGSKAEEGGGWNLGGRMKSSPSFLPYPYLLVLDTHCGSRILGIAACAQSQFGYLLTG